MRRGLTIFVRFARCCAERGMTPTWSLPRTTRRVRWRSSVSIRSRSRTSARIRWRSAACGSAKAGSCGSAARRRSTSSGRRTSTRRLGRLVMTGATTSIRKAASSGSCGMSRRSMPRGTRIAPSSSSVRTALWTFPSRIGLMARRLAGSASGLRRSCRRCAAASTSRFWGALPRRRVRRASSRRTRKGIRRRRPSPASCLTSPR